MKTFGETIGAARIEHKLTLRDLAKIIGVTISRLSEMERNKSDPWPIKFDYTYRHLEEALSFPPNYLRTLAFFEIRKDELDELPEVRQAIVDLLEGAI